MVDDHIYDVPMQTESSSMGLSHDDYQSKALSSFRYESEHNDNINRIIARRTDELIPIRRKPHSNLDITSIRSK